MRHILVVFGVLAGLFLPNQGQSQNYGYTQVGGNYYRFMISDCGDTLIVANLDDVSVSSPRTFANDEEFLRYRRYRQYALKVYPYALEAIRIFKETEYATTYLPPRQANRYIRKLQNELKDEFAEPLRHLTKTQGMILIKMIEKELDTPMYDLVKDLRGGVTATYWNSMGKLFGHDIKSGYEPGLDKVLDAVLNDFDVSYDQTASSDDGY